MTRRRSVTILIAAVVVTALSVLFITISINSIRSSIWFGRIMDRIERDGPSTDNLSEAAKYARRPAEWRALLRIAWNLPEDRRWINVSDLAALAAERFPRDPAWSHLAAYANLRRGRYETASEFFSDDPSPSRLSQQIQVLIAVNQDAPQGTEERLAGFADRDPDEEILVAIGGAAREGTPEALFAAGEATGVSAYYVDSALTAAEKGNRNAARRAVDKLQGYGSLSGNYSQRRAEAYLAAWLRDTEWFFDRLSALGGRRAVAPDMLLMQADFLVEQRQFDRAASIYRELRANVPLVDPVAFSNSAAIQRITARFPDDVRASVPIDMTYRQGISFHPDDANLRMDYATYLISTERRIDAFEVLFPLGPLVPESFESTEEMQTRWLLIRTVLGTRTPVERLEADLWEYLNRAPESHLVARFLARFFIVRQDDRGLRELRQRYAPERAEWAATLHAMQAAEQTDYAGATALFQETDSVAGLYNQALFSIRHDPVDLARQRVAAFRTEAERLDASYWMVRAHLFEAELARLSGDIDRAIQIAERATALNPYSDMVYTYQTILARLR